MKTPPRFSVQRKTAPDYPREMWAVCYADTGETLCVTGPTDCQYCAAEAKAKGLCAILNTSDAKAMNQARSHA